MKVKNTGLVITLSVMFGLFVVFGGTIGYVVSAKFQAAKWENAIIAQDESMQSTWGMMEQSLKMQGFTVKNYSEEFIKSIEANAKRYENDKNAMMKWVQESQSQLSPETHKKFMDTVEKVYVKKEAKQLSKISVVQEYRNFTSSSVKGFVANIVWGYPSDKVTVIMDRIITTKGTKETWETGEEAEASDPFAS